MTSLGRRSQLFTKVGYGDDAVSLLSTAGDNQHLILELFSAPGPTAAAPTPGFYPWPLQ